MREDRWTNETTANAQPGRLSLPSPRRGPDDVARSRVRDVPVQHAKNLSTSIHLDDIDEARARSRARDGLRRIVAAESSRPTTRSASARAPAETARAAATTLATSAHAELLERYKPVGVQRRRARLVYVVQSGRRSAPR